MGRIIPVSLALVALSGCANNEQTGASLGGLGGGGLGGVLGGVISHAGPIGAIGSLAGGLMGTFAGSTIGRRLDARDRQRAAQSMQLVLEQPIYDPQTGYSSPPSMDHDPAAATPSSPGVTSDGRAPATANLARPRAPIPLPPPARPVPTPPLPTAAPTSQWVSDHSGARGSSTVISVQPPSATSGECRTVRNTAYIDGREVTETKRMCLTPANTWKEAATSNGSVAFVTH